MGSFPRTWKATRDLCRRVFSQAVGPPVRFGKVVGNGSSSMKFAIRAHSNIAMSGLIGRMIGIGQWLCWGEGTQFTAADTHGITTFEGVKHSRQTDVQDCGRRLSNFTRWIRGASRGKLSLLSLQVCCSHSFLYPPSTTPSTPRPWISYRHDSTYSRMHTSDWDGFPPSKSWASIHLLEC